MEQGRLRSQVRAAPAPAPTPALFRPPARVARPGGQLLYWHVAEASRPRALQAAAGQKTSAA